MRQQKITFGEMRQTGLRWIRVFCEDYKCSHSVAMNADHWPDDLRISDLEPRFVCQRCGRRGSLIQGDFTRAPEPPRKVCT